MTSNQIAFQKNTAEQALERSAQDIRSRDVAVKEAELPSRIFGNITTGAKDIAQTVGQTLNNTGSILGALNPLNILGSLMPANVVSNLTGLSASDMLKTIFKVIQ